MTKPKDEAQEPEDRAPEDDAEVADRLSSLFGPDDDAPPAKGTPGIRLDKTGALADRPKLQPKKPYARDDAPRPEDEIVRSADADRRPGAPRKATIPPPIGTLRPPGYEEPAPKPPDDEVMIGGGTFLFGEEKETREVPAFRIDRYPVRNAEYEVFVKATGHRPPLYWLDGKMPPQLAEHPVVGVDYFDALAYARWKGKDLPYEDEWERAARGKEGTTYPWGDEVELGQANTARLGLKMTMPVGWYEMNVSPDGVWDTMGNVWEITHSPAPGGGIVVRGGSWFDFVLYAKTWFRFASRPEARNGTIGFRCVRRMKPRPDVEREVLPDVVDAAVDARRGPQPKVDVSTFSAERRDLVPDYRRLGQLMSEREEEEAEARGAALLGRLPGGRERPLRAPVRATPPPPLSTPPPPKPKPAPRPAPKPESRPEPRPTARPAPKPEPRPEPRPTARPAPPPPPPPPPVAEEIESRHRLGLWLVAGAAVVLVGALLALLLAPKGQEPPAPAEGPEVAVGLPEPPAPLETASLLPRPPDDDPRDVQPPVWVDAPTTKGLDRLRRGVWLVVFADLPGEAGAETVTTANALHRSLRDTTARLALVVPRSYFEAADGGLLDEDARRTRLRDLGGTTDLLVILDPPASPPAGGEVRAAYGVVDPQAALVLVDGRRRHRTAPTEGGFTEAALVPLAERAAAIDAP